MYVSSRTLVLVPIPDPLPSITSVLAFIVIATITTSSLPLSPYYRYCRPPVLPGHVLLYTYNMYTDNS